MSFLPNGCFSKPIKVGEFNFETIWHANSLPELYKMSVGDLNKKKWESYINEENIDLSLGKNETGKVVKTTKEALEIKSHKVIADKIHKISKNIPKIELARRKMQRVRSNDEGEEVDIDRYLDNKQDYWIKYKRTKAEGVGYVCIWVNTSSSWRKTDDMLLWRGIVALAIAESLDKQGHSVEIRGYDFSKDAYVGLQAHSLITFPIKSVNEKLITEIACTPLCYSGWVRSWGFKILTRRPDYVSAASYGCAVTSALPREALLAGADDIVIDDIWTEQTALARIALEITRLKAKANEI